jgi:2-polyprenyl-3-methyl-5-hydroxy-6-metoxy-1,4-benzoquinol methylase
MPDLRTRVDILELMDTEPASVASMRRALAFLTFTNRWCGGSDLILRHLAGWAGRWPAGWQTISILDVGTGMADIPMAMVIWARRRGVRLAVTALELVDSSADLARERVANVPEIAIVSGDFFEIANGSLRFDYVTASLFLHHVQPARTVDALIGLDRLARHGLIISDLQRSWTSYAAVSAAGLVLGNRIVRHDAPASVRRAFRAAELDRLARQAGLDYLAARTEPWFRVSLAGEKPDAW